MGVRENTKGTVPAQRMDWPAHHFAIAIQLVAAHHKDYHGDDQDENTEEEEDLD